MKATEARDKIFAASKLLHEVSNAIAKGIEYDGIDPRYLRDKLHADVINIAKHVDGQLKHKMR